MGKTTYCKNIFQVSPKISKNLNMTVNKYNNFNKPENLWKNVRVYFHLSDLLSFKTPQKSQIDVSENYFCLNKTLKEIKESNTNILINLEMCETKVRVYYDLTALLSFEKIHLFTFFLLK